MLNYNQREQKKKKKMIGKETETMCNKYKTGI